MGEGRASPVQFSHSLQLSRPWLGEQIPGPERSGSRGLVARYEGGDEVV